MKLFIKSVLIFALLSTLVVAATVQGDEVCPNYDGDYCCGVTRRAVQNCDEPMHIDQQPMEGGQDYAFIKEAHTVSILLADGKVRPLDSNTYTGDATTTCRNSTVLVTVPKAGLRQLPHATGFYMHSVHLAASGWMTFRSYCSFHDRGTPVATSCGIGTGYGCQKK